MKIYIDASRAVRPRETGVEHYSREIIHALINLPHAQEHEFILLSPRMPEKNHDLHHLPDWARWNIVPGKHLWTLIGLSNYTLRESEIYNSPFFIPGHTIPLVSSRRTTMTFHDFAYRLYPDAYGRLNAWLMDQELRRSTQKAYHIIVPSHATENDLMNYYGIERSRISVIPHGVDHEIFKPLTPKEHANLPVQVRQVGPYFLHLGRLELRKNILRLLTAYQNLVESQSDVPKLVFIGQPGYGWSTIKKRLDRMPSSVRQKIILLGHVDQLHFPIWLKAATALVYPTLYEGFGFPALQAMASGTPVICSSISSLPELVSTSAVLVEPNSTTSIEKGMKKLINNPSFHQKLSTSGITRAKNYHWKETAEKTLTIITH